MRRRRKPPVPDETTSPVSRFDPNVARFHVYEALRERLGNDVTAAIQADFELHLLADPVHGVEMGYICLLGKMIEYMDVMNDASPLSQHGSPDSVSGFTVFRKAVDG